MTLKQIVEDTDTRSGRALDLFIQTLIILSLVTFSLETLPDLKPSTRGMLRVFEIFSIVVFTAEYLIRLVVSDRKLGFVFSFYGLIDLAAIVPFYITTGVDLRSVRVFRLLRLFRVFKLMRYNQAMRRFRAAFATVREELVVFTTFCLFIIFFLSVGIYYLEKPAQPEAFSSLFDCMWWAAATLTTVGYGDIYPITAGGRIFTFLILLVGLGIIAVPAGLIASALSQVLRREGVTETS